MIYSSVWTLYQTHIAFIFLFLKPIKATTFHKLKWVRLNGTNNLIFISVLNVLSDCMLDYVQRCCTLRPCCWLVEVFWRSSTANQDPSNHWLWKLRSNTDSKIEQSIWKSLKNWPKSVTDCLTCLNVWQLVTQEIKEKQNQIWFTQTIEVLRNGLVEVTHNCLLWFIA